MSFAVALFLCFRKVLRRVITTFANNYLSRKGGERSSGQFMNKKKRNPEAEFILTENPKLSLSLYKFLYTYKECHIQLQLFFRSAIILKVYLMKNYKSKDSTSLEFL